MRIIAGSAGGRRLASPETRAIRPTPERVREAIFSMLGDIRDAVVVDGFAGSGAMGCEALSRGARACYFIDRSDEAMGLIEENLERIEARGQGILLQGSFAAQLAMIDGDPDLWLIDPPYEEGQADDALEAMAGARAVTDGALVVVEQDARQDLAQVAGFELADERIYGRTSVTFLRRVVDEG